jgi:ribosomal protein S24E
MEFKITIEEEQKLLDRKMIKGELNFSEKSVPSRMQVLEAIAKKLKVDKTLIIVKEIKSIFGSTNATFEAHIYSSLDIKNKLEPKHLIKRNEIKVAEKKEEKKAEEKPAEAPKEEPKKVEEKPAEVPKKEEAPKEEKKVEAPVEEKKE